MSENSGDIRANITRLLTVVYEGTSNNKSIFLLTQNVEKLEERVKIIENRVNGYAIEDRKSQRQVFWGLLVLIVLALAKFLNVDLNYFKSLTGM